MEERAQAHRFEVVDLTKRAVNLTERRARELEASLTIEKQRGPATRQRRLQVRSLARRGCARPSGSGRRP